MHELKKQYNEIAKKQQEFLQEIDKYKIINDGQISYDIPIELRNDINFTKKEADYILQLLSLENIEYTAYDLLFGFKEDE